MTVDAGHAPPVAAAPVPRTARGAAIWLWSAGAMLVINSAYLLAADRPRPALLANVLLHLLAGLVLVVPFSVWWWRRRTHPALFAAGLLLIACTAAGLLLCLLGNRRALQPLLWTHAALALAGLGALLAAFAGARRSWWFRVSAAGLLFALLLPVLAIGHRIWQRRTPQSFVNPPLARDMAGEAIGGAAGPFYPSPASTGDGALVPASFMSRSAACGAAGCHPAELTQWASSPHHFSGVNNPWYRAVAADARRERGETAVRWCAGCHTPALLLSGRASSTPVDSPAAQEGVGCLDCHAISRVKSTTGQGNYEITVPDLERLAVSGSSLARGVSRLLMRIDPELHRRSFSQPLTASSELCATCHAAYIDRPVNDYRWFEVFDDYEPWQSSPVSGQAFIRANYPVAPRGCVDCHMPPPSRSGTGGSSGRPRSHRFAAANTALPAWGGDARQLQEVTSYLQGRQFALDIFAMTPGRPLATTGGSPPGPPPGGRPGEPPERIVAPLNRLPATLRRGDETRIDVLVYARGLGHSFPSGKADLPDCWLELKGSDDRGQTVFWSGKADDGSAADPGAHRFELTWVDQRGERVAHHAEWNARAAVGPPPIDAGGARLVHFALRVPPAAGNTLTLTARLRYRKFRPDFTSWAFSSLGLAAPRLPIITVAEDTVSLRVVDAAAPLPAMQPTAGAAETDSRRWNDYGFALFLEGRRGASANVFRQALRLAPRAVNARVNLAWVELLNGDHKGARADLDEALNSEPRSARAHLFLGLLARDEGRLDEAVAHLRVSEAQFPRNAETKHQIGNILFTKGDYRGCVAVLEQAVAVVPQDSSLHFALMQCYRALGNGERAAYHQALFARLEPDRALTRGLVNRYLAGHPELDAELGFHLHHSLPLPAPAGGEETGR
jgi:tetratricopeptide (TPR) repeat protein